MGEPPLTQESLNLTSDGEQETSVPSRIFEKCETTMTHLSNLQPRLFGTALRVFRCYTCTKLISEEW
jgi:hypothetical protein